MAKFIQEVVGDDGFYRAVCTCGWKCIFSSMFHQQAVEDCSKHGDFHANEKGE